MSIAYLYCGTVRRFTTAAAYTYFFFLHIQHLNKLCKCSCLASTSF